MCLVENYRNILSSENVEIKEIETPGENHSNVMNITAHHINLSRGIVELMKKYPVNNQNNF